MNTKAIADAIALQFVGITAGGVALALGPTASLPNTIAKGPALLVFHPTGVLDIGMSQMRDDHLDFPVRLLTDPLNYPGRSDALYAWADAMRDQVPLHVQLGLAYVATAQPVSMHVALDGHDYAGITYDVVELIVRVHVYEHVSGVAA